MSKGPAFGTQFTPHMILQRYEGGRWAPAEIAPYGPFSLAPSAAVFHYAQELFEGFATEAQNRERDRIPDVASYLRLREVTVGDPAATPRLRRRARVAAWSGGAVAATCGM